MRAAIFFVIAIVMAPSQAHARVAAADTFRVQRNGTTDYVIDGVNDPALELQRGLTYLFHVLASGHPFWIKTQLAQGDQFAYNDGVTGNGTDFGDITFAVPQNAPATLYYICGIHGAMNGQIHTHDGSEAGVGPGPAMSSFRIVPNPARGSVAFERSADLSGHALEVLDPAGRVLWRSGVQAATLRWEGRRADGSHVASGLYLVRTRDDRGRAITRRLLWLGR
jgi:hypothetical protein